MRPSEHYAEAERLLRLGEQVDAAGAVPVLLAAQVHATLATAGAAWNSQYPVRIFPDQETR